MLLLVKTRKQGQYTDPLKTVPALPPSGKYIYIFFLSKSHHTTGLRGLTAMLT